MTQAVTIPPPARPDVDAYDGPLRREIFNVIARLAEGELTPDDFQAEMAALFDRMPLTEVLADLIARALAERRHQVLYRKTTPEHSIWIQLLYLAPREVHAPHGHRDQISNQMLLAGRTYLREYDRIARVDERTLLLKLRSDGWMARGQRMQTTEVERNVHWFAAAEEPAVQFNFVVAGYQQWLFDAHLNHRARIFIDPTGPAQRDGLILAREIDSATAEAKFGGRAITDFPIPRPARGG